MNQRISSENRMIVEMKNLILCLLCLMVGLGLHASSAHGDSLRIMSYNVHNGIGMDGKVDYARIAHVISDVHPDVVALQELDSVTHRSPVNVLEEIAGVTGMNYVFGPAISYGGGKYGIGVMSKEKPLNVRNVFLPGKEEARTLLVVEFEKYIFLATHFSLTAADQIKSVEVILKEALSKEKPVFMAGDMNSVPSSLTQKNIRKYFKVLTDDRWITCNGECIDYIYGYKRKKGKFTVGRKGMIEDYVASDHCPVYVDVYYGK